MTILSLGDSLAAGWLAAQNYTAQVCAMLAVTACLNFGVPGLESRGLAAMVSLPLVQASLARADLVLVDIGGNDYLQGIRCSRRHPIQRSRCLAATTARFAQRWALAVEAIRRAAPTAQVVALAIYRPYAATPSSAWTDEAIAEAGWAAIQQAFQAGAETAGWTVVDLAPIFAGHPEYLAIDRLHPNDAGHAAIAATILDALQE